MRGDTFKAREKRLQPILFAASAMIRKNVDIFETMVQDYTYSPVGIQESFFASQGGYGALAVQAESISNIMSVISDLADRTSLFALIEEMKNA